MLIDELEAELKRFKNRSGLTVPRVSESKNLVRLMNDLSPGEIVSLVEKASTKIEETADRAAVRAAFRFDYKEQNVAERRLAAAGKPLLLEWETMRKRASRGVRSLAIFVADELRRYSPGDSPSIVELSAGPGNCSFSFSGIGKFDLSDNIPAAGTFVPDHYRGVDVKHIIFCIEDVAVGHHAWIVKTCLRDDDPEYIDSVEIYYQPDVMDSTRLQKMVEYRAPVNAVAIEVSMLMDYDGYFAQRGANECSWRLSDIEPFTIATELRHELPNDSDSVGLYELRAVYFYPSKEKPALRIFRNDVPFMNNQ
ncbi:hypothetical protein [Glutamicibacter halophytocola]|uniref:hypothetical protein n=1 Tax=Glutamicibacter halophytocola TaxID=1933880 RepID=UPI0015C54CB0|nr:hypothetical protein [Glutamicibacter halophytocola]NQD39949.1 hypothetical protein [Glutamicibacter halophytocola]